MVSGTEQIAGKLAKLKGLRELPVYEAVEREVTGFASSLPLMRELKGEALRCVPLQALGSRARSWDVSLAFAATKSHAVALAQGSALWPPP
jgi:hypothetical protein